MTLTTTFFGAICSALLIASAAQAQGTGTGTAGRADTMGDPNVDCLKDTYSGSGTGSSRPLKTHRSSAATAAYLQTHGTVPGAYMQCTANKDRAARVQCIQKTYENRVESTSLASNSSRRPC